MKKLTLLMLSLMLAGMIAACGAPQTVQVTVPVQQTKVVQVTAPPEASPEPTAKPTGKITVWGWTAAIRDTIEASGVLADFQAAYPDIEVEIVYHSPQDVYTSLPLALTAGTGAPDVCLVENSHLAEYVHMGGLLDLTDRVQPYIDQMNDYKWADCTKDGSYYCLPWDSGPVVMYYRRDVFDQAGLSSKPEDVSNLVATWDDYLNVCRTIKEKTGAYCFAHNKANNYGRLYEMVLWEQGLGYYDAATGEVTADSPENIATLEMLGRFWQEDLVSDALEWTDPWYAELAATEKPIATLVEASWMEIFLKSWIAPGTAGKWGVAYMPAWSAGGARASNDGGSVFVIPAQTRNPDAAWAFVEFVLGRRQSQLKMFAISGIFPSLETTYDDALFMEGDSFLGGQNARKIYADVVQKIPRATVYGPHYAVMNGSVSVAIQKYATGQASAADALRVAAEEIRAAID